MARSFRRALLALVALALVVFSAPPAARAQAAPAGASPTWGAQLESVAEWLAQRNPATACTVHCFVLTRLHLAGAAGGEMHFTMEGAVLATQPVAVPLFGTPTQARIDHVTENGKPAAVGFEGDHWFVLTASRRFTVEGTLRLDGDLALTVPGPLDSLDADLTSGRIVEGAHLGGLLATTVHFDRDTAASPAEEPPVFQLSRAVRISRETTFEYRLVLRSGRDLGVVRLPLGRGEKVLDVQGSANWAMQGTDLTLPTAGRSAQITITGTLDSAGRLEPDARSAYEWMLVESDAEHRLTVGGDARQVDASESPIARTQPSARLFLVARGQHIDVSAQPLVATEALAAVVRGHDRTLVLTARGDLVADDVLSYENDGVDWLAWPPTGRAVFLATDGKAERVMRAAEGAGDVLVPLRVGSHEVHLQSMSSASLRPLAGWLSVPTPKVALATSRASVTLGLPATVHPLAVMGGDHPWVAFGGWDLFALVLSLAVAMLLLRGKLRRGLGVVALAGLWFAAPALWVTLAIGGSVAGAGWASARLLPRGPRYLAWAALGVAAFVAGIGSMSMRSKAPDAVVTALPQHEAVDHSTTVDTTAAPAANAVADDLEKNGEKQGGGWGGQLRGAVAQSYQQLGQVNARSVLAGGIVQGVAPVALPLPAYERSVVVRRELVTSDRPLTIGVLYVTSLGLLPLLALWMASVAFLARLHASQLARFARAVRERLARQPEPNAPAPAPAAPPPVVA
ncbi:MAG TPA: hypothetical protein VIY73_17435 [Polyangiaceae bacterium]